MASVSFTVRMNEKLKNNFKGMCESFGINMTVAINLFATAVVNDGRILFDIKNKYCSREEAIELFESTRAKALSKNPNGMTLDEINEIISEVRAENRQSDLRA